MIVSHAHKFIFFHNPKCAGTSLRQVLAQHHDDAASFWGVLPAAFFCNKIDHAHLRLWELHALYPRVIAAAETYRSVIFVRNPYQRFASALDEYFRIFELSDQLAALAPAEQVRAIEMFVDFLNIQMVMTDWRFVHFSPQLWFIWLGNRQVPRRILAIDDEGAFMARAFEYLGLDYQDVGHSNPSRLNLMHVLASPTVAAFVRRFYALDFEFFAADPALKHLTALPASLAEPATSS